MGPQKVAKFSENSVFFAKNRVKFVMEGGTPPDCGIFFGISCLFRVFDDFCAEKRQRSFHCPKAFVFRGDKEMQARR